RGHDHFAPLLDGIADDRFEPVIGILVIGMLAVAVGAFHYQDVGLIQKYRVIQDGAAGAADIAAEDQALERTTVLILDIQRNEGRTEHMPRVVESQRDAGGDAIRPFITNAEE